MSVKEAAEMVGKACVVTDGIGFQEPLMIPARILDVRQNWGRTDYRVTPIGGSGETWVSAERVTVSE